MRVLTVMNFGADPAAPQRGRWVVDQVEALRQTGMEVELFTFQPGKAQYLPATRRIRNLIRENDFDLVHAHYGLAGWCAALAGAKPLVVTFHGTDVRHRIVGPMSRALTRRIELVAGASKALFETESGRPGLPRPPGRTAVLPCGADLSRFDQIDRQTAKEKLGLDPSKRYLFFPADPTRPEKRFDRAEEVARNTGVELLTGGRIAPEEMSLWINAANAVLVTSDNEGFGLACLETLACNVPVMSTPVGVAPHACSGVEQTLCKDYETASWSRFASKMLEIDDPRTQGRPVSQSFSAGRMADRVAVAYREILGNSKGKPVPVVELGNDGGSR